MIPDKALVRIKKKWHPDTVARYIWANSKENVEHGMRDTLQNSKIEYSWKDIEEAKKTGAAELKEQVLKILDNYNNTPGYQYIKQEIERL